MEPRNESTIKTLSASELPSRTHCEKHGEALVPAAVPDWMEDKGNWTKRVHGITHAYCPKCADEDQAEEKVRQQKAQEEVWLQRRKGAGIPLRFLDASLQDFPTETDDQQETVAVLQQFKKTYGKDPSSLIFSGKMGVGKSHAAAACVSVWLRSGRTARFTSAMDLVRTIRDTWGTQTQEKTAVKKYTELDLLAIDEIGVQTGTPNERAILSDIINARYENLRPTIVIGNLTVEEFNAFLGERSMDRFREGGRMLVFPWQSRRGQK